MSNPNTKTTQFALNELSAAAFFALQAAALSGQDRCWWSAGCWLSLGRSNTPFTRAGDTRGRLTFQTEAMKIASDKGTESQCYRFRVQRSWQPTIYLLEIRLPFSPTAMGVSSCSFALRPGSWQINCNKSLPPAAAPCVQLPPTPGQDTVRQPL